MSSGNDWEQYDHSRTIIHIDLDCFYAQVEMIKNPSLRDVPLGVKQKNLLVTCNYIARECGVKKCCPIAEAKQICPNLVLVNGEDLHDYRKLSYEVTNLLQKYSLSVERLGLDENYIDVTNIVKDRIGNVSDVQIRGHVFGETKEICECGCQERLRIGSVIAEEIRIDLKTKLNLTSCAGIAHNKLLAKLVGSVHKPNQQTTVFPNSALELMLSLKSISNIPGVGHTMAECLERLNIKSVEDVHNCNFEELQSVLQKEKARWLVDACYGKDLASVKPSGKPQSIGLEDSCKMISAEREIKEKFQHLLNRLIILVAEDGRIPMTIKVTIRKLDKISHRESRQCNINPSLFTIEKDSNTITMNQQSEIKLMTIVMNLFNKLVNMSHSFHITLLGLSFTKFLERLSGRNSIASYFVKDVTVQSVTSIENVEKTKKTFINVATDKPTSSHRSMQLDVVEADVEPTPKKSKVNPLNIKHLEDNSSPSKLKVAELCLNCKRSEEETEAKIAKCPPGADEEVFRELPIDLQQELWNEWKCKRQQDDENASKPQKRAKTNTLLNYLIKN